jgi:hypothetical protein
MGCGASTYAPSPDTADNQSSTKAPSKLAPPPVAPKEEPKSGLASADTSAVVVAEALFSALDANASGTLDAGELLAAVSGLNLPELGVDAVNALIREADLNGDGQIQLNEFEMLLKNAEAPADQPHLILHFDVNQTVIMVDSVINAGVELLLNALLSNTCWGRIVDAPVPDGADVAESALPGWELVSSVPSVEAPEESLKTYLQYAVVCTPIPNGAELSAVQAAKAKRRSMIQQFTDAGSPGEPIAPQIADLIGKMRLPKDVVAAADPAVLEALGLSSGIHILLPSFLHALRALKKQGRSFSVCFRTFGKDLPKLAAEFNALCEGTHPLFHAEEKIVLDGSDGGRDMRMDIGAGSAACGTWVRAPDGGLSLVMGTIEQPPREKSTAADLPGFYEELGGAAVEIIGGTAAVADRLRSELHKPGEGRTLALRDYYPGWEAAGCKASGGKPLLLESDPRILQLFFDDHILAGDAHIVDARRAAMPDGPPLSIGATFGVHLLRAEPLLSISSSKYFIEAIAKAEAAWQVALRRHKVLIAALTEHGMTISKENAPRSSTKYVPHAALASVRNATDVAAADDDDAA